MAAALALSQQGFGVEVFEQSAEIGEIGAGLQLGPNGFAAMDALGVGERARRSAVFTDELVMMDAIDGSEVARIPVGEAFRRRFNNPYAVIHRADIHQSLYEEVKLVPDIQVHTSARVVRVDVDDDGARLVDASGSTHNGAAVVGCDGVHSIVRHRLIGDGHRVSGHVVYRALVPRADMPADLLLERRGDLGWTELPSRPLPFTRGRAIQHRGHVSQPRAGAMGGARRIARRGDVVFHRDLRTPAPASR